jgi:hypothetical protein
MCEVRSRKNGQEPKEKVKKSTVVSSKKKSTVMSPIRRQMKKRNPSGGQNGQLVHWWVLIHSGRYWFTLALSLNWPFLPPNRLTLQITSLCFGSNPIGFYALQQSL